MQARFLLFAAASLSDCAASRSGQRSVSRQGVERAVGEVTTLVALNLDVLQGAGED
jgi:hypothetical protein